MLWSAGNFGQNAVLKLRSRCLRGQSPAYPKRGFDSQYYRDLIVALVREHQPVSRRDIDTLLLVKLPEILTEDQKLNRIHNLLRQLADAGHIQNAGGRRWPKWVLGGAVASPLLSKKTSEYSKLALWFS